MQVPAVMQTRKHEAFILWELNDEAPYKLEEGQRRDEVNEGRWTETKICKENYVYEKEERSRKMNRDKTM